MARRPASAPTALIPTIAGRTAESVGDPHLVAVATWALVQGAAWGALMLRYWVSREVSTDQHAATLR